MTLTRRGTSSTTIEKTLSFIVSVAGLPCLASRTFIPPVALRSIGVNGA